MKSKFILASLLSFSFYLLSSQVPQGFNYQAVATDITGNPLVNSDIQVKTSILTDTIGFFASGAGVYLYEELHSVKTNGSGVFSLVVGSGSWVQGSLPAFNQIDWNSGPLFIGIKVLAPSSTWKNMGTSKLNSVPYAMVADKANGVIPGTKLSVVSEDDGLADALFEVKRADGQTVFAVYPDAVNIYVPRTGKGSKGGFAIGGFEVAKKGEPLPPQDYFRVTPDSVRVYIDPTPAAGKGSKGGFAIGGYGEAKGINDMYFNLSGASSVNTVAESPQILWYPIKKAFLAGSIHIGSVDSVGQNSTALGYRSIAMGDFSQAFGYKAKAFGDYSTSIGKNSVAGSKTVPLADNAFAFGNGAKATGNDSYALGSGSIASGYRSFAFGSVGLNDSGDPTSTPTTAGADYTVAIGMGAQATQRGGMALGIGAISSGYYSNSFGYYSTASNYYATALGFRSSATNRYSGAFGYYAKADGQSSLALGYNSWAVNNFSTAVGAFSKTSADYASAFGRSALAQGISSVAVGYGAQTGATAADASAFGKSANASGASSMALGISASSVGVNSIAIGNAAVANGTYSTSMGSSTTTSVGASYSTSIGYGSSTAGQYATALGYYAQANGAKSISIGAYYNYTYIRFIYDPITRRFVMTPVSITKYNIANDDYSIAIGNGNTSAEGGLTVGSNNSALKIGAVAIGHTNVADSAYSFAAGANNYSRGYNAFALGESLIAESVNSFVVGYNNLTNASYSRTEWVATDPLFVVGNGGSGSRSNALVVAKNGNTTINGNLTVTGSISSFAGTGDNLGTHTATQNLKMSGYWLSNDGGNEGVWVGTTGLVGINDASPSYTLDIAGTLRATSTMLANSDLYVTGGIFGSAINSNNNANLSVDAGTLHIDGTNNRVGINNTTPVYTLDITGSLNATSSGKFGGDLTLSSTSPGILFTDTDADNFKFEANAGLLSITDGAKIGPVTYFAIGSNGAIGMPALRTGTGTALVWNSTVGEVVRLSSSLRYKTDINDLTDVSWLFNLKPVDYLYKTDTEKQRQYGLIAEDVAEVNNDLVFYDNGQPDAVNYNGLIAPLLKAVQDQKKTIETLEENNENLQKRIEKLEAIILSTAEIK